MRRYCENLIREDLKQKIVFISGPRQVGKTTLARQLSAANTYLNYDSGLDRKVMQELSWQRKVDLVIFDELHKMKNWKSWLKGIYDTEGIKPGLLVTGSARLDTFRKGGDSLAGRFFSYRLHPLSVKEIVNILHEPASEAMKYLMDLGGFPEPYLSKSLPKSRRWRKGHLDIIIRQDLLDLEKVRDLKSIEILIDLLKTRVGSSVSYNSLATDLQVSIPTVKHWLQILENLYVIFSVRPYHKNVARSILKEPKYYFYDTGAVEGDSGQKYENLVAGALLKEINFLEDTSGCSASLHYIRDKEKREVDFLVVINNKPAFLIEAKWRDDTFSKALIGFQQKLGKIPAVQVVAGLSRKKTLPSGIEMVPAAEFLENLSLDTFLNRSIV